MKLFPSACCTHTRRRTLWTTLLIAYAWLVLLSTAHAQVSKAQKQNARELNNRGTVLVHQESAQAAAEKFAKAYKLDPHLSAADTSERIALLYLGQTQKATTDTSGAAQ